ncbi:MAG: hypothetical protein WC732_05345 [Candidatus Omnitrophota bacterium]
MNGARFKKTIRSLALVVFWALLCVQAVQAADPVVVELHYQNGVKFYKRGLYDRAVQEFEKTLNLDPKHEDARIFLEKVRLIRKNQTAGDAEISKDVEIKELYAQGRRLYQERRYEDAIETFNKILELKPIDDFASFYKERSEILLSKKLAREKSLLRKQQLKEARLQAKEDRRKEKQELARKRKEAKTIARLPVRKENRKSMVAHDLAAYETEAQSRAVPEGEKEPLLNKKAQLKQDRLALKEKKRQEKLQAKEDRKREKEERAAAKKALAQERRQAKIDKRQEDRLRKQQAREDMRQGKKESREALKRRKQEERGYRVQEAAARKESIRMEKGLEKDAKKEAAKLRAESKQLFLKGVEAYGRRQYEESIAAFEELIQKEDEAKTPVYTNTARRMMQKAQDRLKGVGKDQEIGKTPAADGKQAGF